MAAAAAKVREPGQRLFATNGLPRGTYGPNLAPIINITPHLLWSRRTKFSVAPGRQRTILGWDVYI